MKWKLLSRVRLFETPWTVQSVEFSRPEYWNRQPFPCPGDLPKPGIKPRSPALQADSLPAEPQGKPKSTGLGNLSLLQWIFPTQELNQIGGGLITKMWPPLAIPWTVARQASLSIGFSRILKWIAIAFSRGSSWPRNWPWVSCIAGRYT